MRGADTQLLLSFQKSIKETSTLTFLLDSANDFISGICHDADVLIERWEVVRTLFMDYAESVIAALAPVAEAISNPFSIEEQYLSQDTMESRIMTVEYSKYPAKKYDTEARRRPQRVQMHYNYITRAVRNQLYQRRAYCRQVL